MHKYLRIFSNRYLLLYDEFFHKHADIVTAVAKFKSLTGTVLEICEIHSFKSRETLNVDSINFLPLENPNDSLTLH